MFDLVGNKLGTLLQSVPGSLARAPGWDVPMRVLEREEKEAAFTFRMMERIAHGPSTPDSECKRGHGSGGPSGAAGPNESSRGLQSPPSPRSRVGNFLAEIAASEDDSAGDQGDNARGGSISLPEGSSDAAVSPISPSTTTGNPAEANAGCAHLDRSPSIETHNAAIRLTGTAHK